MSRPNAELDALQRDMQSVRGALEHDVDEFVESTKKLVDWKSYVINFPVATTVAAVAAGYLLIPARKEIVSPDASALAKLAKRNKLVVQTNPSPQKRSGLAGTIFGLASSMVFRGLTTYVGEQAGKMTGAVAAQGPPASSPPGQPVAAGATPPIRSDA